MKTRNGETIAGMQGLPSDAATQETLALLEILALGNRQIEEGEVVPAAEAFRALRSRYK